MADTFKYVLLALVRDKAILIWALAFPIVLSCCFLVMFQGLDEVAQASEVRVVVVDDAALADAPALAAFVDAASEDAAAEDGTAPAEDGAVFAVTWAGTPAEAEEAVAASLEGDEPYAGYVTADAEGMPVVHLPAGGRSAAASMDGVRQEILVQVMDAFCSKMRLVEGLLASSQADASPQAPVDPQAFASPAALAEIFQAANVTEQVELTKNAPKESVRYYFALLGMAAMFGAQAALLAVCALLPNTSPLGARRALGGVSRSRALLGCMAASWLVSFACLVVAYLFMRFVAGVDFGGRDLPCLGALAAASLMAVAFGSLIGSLPKLPLDAKAGMLTGIVCFASLFAGLYGQPTMELADLVAEACPASQYVNPAVQVSQAMYALTYYDSLLPWLGHVAVLVAMAAIFFLASARFLGRQRYASL